MTFNPKIVYSQGQGSLELSRSRALSMTVLGVIASSNVVTPNSSYYWEYTKNIFRDVKLLYVAMAVWKWKFVLQL